MNRPSIPGKIFLLGEYAVLAGLPGLIAAVGPRFSLREGSSSAFHPQSPAGLLLSYADRKLGGGRASQLVSSWKFEDPFRGAGGFGASTAQFALIYQAVALDAGWELSWSAAWKLYRELTRREPEFLSPSGADLVAQWQGGLTWFDSPSMRVEDFSNRLDLSALMVFSATGQEGRKVATHVHLDSLHAGEWKELSARWQRVLRAPLETGAACARSGDLAGLGRAMDQYADALGSLELEVATTREDRRVLRGIPGVLGVKGAGALQSDAVLVLIDATDGVRAQVRQVAESRGLRLVCDGIEKQEGLKK